MKIFLEILAQPQSSFQKIQIKVPAAEFKTLAFDLSSPQNVQAAFWDKLIPLVQIKTFVHAGAHEGEANAELLELFSKTLKVPKSALNLESGAKSRRKKIAIDLSLAKGHNQTSIYATLFNQAEIKSL